MANGSHDTINEAYDLVVIGAGPAGCASAIWGAQNGLEVALLESNTTNRSKPGESFHPGIFTLLKILGLRDEIEKSNFLRYSGQTVSWGQTPRFQSFGSDKNGSWLGVHIPRNEFESLLLKRAIALGVKVEKPCVALSPISEDERVIGVKTSNGQLRCKFVIDATGGRHWLGRHKKLDINYASQRLIAYYGYTGVEPLEEDMGSYLDANIDGWTWVARINAGSFAWTYLPFIRSKIHSIKIPSRLSSCVTLSQTKGVDVTWRSVTQSAGLGFFLTGDAASVLDPLSSDGVIRALMSGIQASYSAHSILKKGENENKVIKYYQDWCSHIFNEEVKKLKSLYDDIL